MPSLVHGRAPLKSKNKNSPLPSSFSKKLERIGSRALINASERGAFTGLTGLAGMLINNAGYHEDRSDAPQVLFFSGLVGGALFGAAKGIIHTLEGKKSNHSAPRPTVIGTMGESVICGLIGYALLSSMFKIKTPFEFMAGNYLIGGACTGYLAHLGNWKIDG